MEGLAVAAAITLLVIVSAVSTRVLLYVLVPSRREVQRLQTARIEHILREEVDLGELGTGTGEC